MKIDEYLALRLYECYCRAVGGKAYDGKRLPDWQHFASDPAKEKQADGWRAVASLALELVPDRLTHKPPLVHIKSTKRNP